MSPGYPSGEASTGGILHTHNIIILQHFQKEMPVKFEADPDSVFSLAFSLNINPKKMKRIEKEYMTMKSKEAEDEMEIRVR